MRSITFDENGWSGQREPDHGHGLHLRATAQPAPTPLWIGTADAGQPLVSGRNMSVEEVRALRDLCNEVLEPYPEPVVGPEPKYAAEEIVARFVR